MAQVEEVRATLTADVGQFQAGFTKAAGIVQTFGLTTTGGTKGLNIMRGALQAMTFEAIGATGAVGRLASGGTTTGGTKGLNIMRGALQAMTFEAIGATGAVGRLASGVALFAGASSLALAVVLAPLAGIAIGFKRAQKAAKDFQDQLDVDRARRQRELDAIGTATLVPEQISARLQDARQALATAMGVVIGPARLNAEQLADALSGRLGPAAQSAAQKILALQDAFDKATESEREFAKEQQNVVQLVASDIQGMGDEIARTLQYVSEQWEATTQKLKLNAPGGGVVISKQDLDTNKAAWTALGDETRRGQERLVALFKQGTQRDDLRLTMQDMGRDAIRAFVQGLVEGTGNFADFIASLFKRFLVGGIIDAITGGLFSFGGSPSVGGKTGATTGKFEAVAPGVSGALMSPDLVVNLPPAQSPFDQARDVVWQRALRESLAVARQNGYRFT